MMPPARDSISPPASSRSTASSGPRRSLTSTCSSLTVESHSLLSVLFLTIRPFPRFVRISLLFLSFYVTMAFCALMHPREVAVFYWDLEAAFVSVLVSNVVVGIISCINHVDRKPLERAKTTNEFIQKSRSIERALQIRWGLVVFLALGVDCFCMLYIALYCHVMSAATVDTAMGSAILGIAVDWAIVQPLYILCLLGLKQGSKQPVLKAMHRCATRLRMWKSTNPEGD